MAFIEKLTEELSSWQDTAKALEELNSKLGPRLKLIDEYTDISADGVVGEAILSSFHDAKAIVDEVRGDLETFKEGIVATKVAAIEARITLLEQRAAGDDGEVRKDGGNGKIDTRDIPSWAGPHAKEFTEYQWGFHIALDAAKQNLGQWAEWAFKKSLLRMPIAERTD